MSDTAKWVLQISAALVCASFIYQYIGYKLEMMNSRKRQQEVPLNILVSDYETMERDRGQNLVIGSNSFKDVMNELNDLWKQGFLIGLDTSLVIKYPQIIENANHDLILVTNEVEEFARKQSKVVGIRNYKGVTLDKDESISGLIINEPFVEKIGLDSKSISDRAIGTYLYAEKTNLINVIFATLDPSTYERAKHVGLRAILF